MKTRFVIALALAAAALVASWTVSFASAPGGSAGGLVQVVPREDLPAFQAPRGIVAPVPSGDLFIVDARHRAGDLPVSLLLVNGGDMASTCRYVIFRVGLWRLDDAGARFLAAPEDLLTLLDARVSFVLPGGARYVLALDGGSLATFPAGSGGAPVAPEFFVTTD